MLTDKEKEAVKIFASTVAKAQAEETVTEEEGHLKTGVKTTEFWAMVIFVALAVARALGLQMDDNTFYAVALIVGIYMPARALPKIAEMWRPKT